MIEVVRFLADLPAASLEIEGFGLGHAALAYAGLAAFAWWVQPRRPAAEVISRLANRVLLPLRWASRPLRFVPTSWAAGILALAAALLWWANLSGGDGRLVVSVMDVGQGDAILVRGPGGHKLLIDGGPDAQAVREALGRELPFWDRHLDLVVLTHPQDDHLTGLVEVVERYDVDVALAPPIEQESAGYEALRGALGEQGVELVEAVAGQWVDLGDGARLEVLAPPDDGIIGTRSDVNNNSVVLKLTWDGISFLLTGDIEAEGEAALIGSGEDLRATVLKAPHHGSATSSGQAFLRAVRPAVAVISVGAENRFAHPSPSVLERLDNTLTYRTDLNGRIRLSTDGERLWVEVDRGSPSP
jgi:competence protein ComEC